MVDKIVICRSNPVDPDPRVEKIARSLIKAGYQVQAIGWDRTSKLPKEQALEGFHITRLGIPARYGTGLMNLPALLAWQLGLWWWLVTNRNAYNAIHACDFDTVLPALFCKAVWKKPVIYDIFDFYADHLRRTPRLIKELIRRIDFWAIRQADGVIIVDDSRSKQIRGSRPKICISIYNSPDDVYQQPDEKSAAPGEPILRVAYIGLLQAERGLYEMIDVIARHPEWHLHVAGFGGDEDQIAEKVNKLPNATWYGRIAYNDALKLSQEADILFATYDPAIPNHRYSSPNKVFEAMMLGKPIIVAEDTNMDRMIAEANCGIVVKYGEQAAIEQALVQLAEDHNLREVMGKNGRRAYEETYSWQKMQVRLNNFYHQLLKSRQSS